MNLLKQSTAATLKLGPFLDDTDGKTAETGLTISQADVRLSKNGGNMAQKNDATSCTHDELGYYDCPVSTTDTGTLGRLDVMVHESGALPVFASYMVVPANVYDSLVGGTDYLDSNAAQIEGADATDQINTACDAALADYDAPTKAELDSGLAALNDLDAAGIRTAVGLASANLDTQLAALPTATENADELLKRDWTSVSGEASRSVLNALRLLRNKWTISGGTLTVYEEDDSTSAWTGTATTDSGADPVTAVDPA